MTKLTRYWFEFDVNSADENVPPGIVIGCGLTAFNYDDALFILAKDMFKDRQILPIKRFIENVDISQLETTHVLTNIIMPSVYRGVWYPQGYNFLK